MSVETINGKLCIVIDAEFQPEQELLRRMHALVQCIQNQNKDLLDHETLYYTLDMLKDMLPNEEQISNLFHQKDFVH